MRIRLHGSSGRDIAEFIALSYCARWILMDFVAVAYLSDSLDDMGLKTTCERLVIRIMAQWSSLVGMGVAKW